MNENRVLKPKDEVILLSKTGQSLVGNEWYNEYVFPGSNHCDMKE